MFCVEGMGEATGQASRYVGRHLMPLNGDKRGGLLGGRYGDHSELLPLWASLSGGLNQGGLRNLQQCLRGKLRYPAPGTGLKYMATGVSLGSRQVPFSV